MVCSRGRRYGFPQTASLMWSSSTVPANILSALPRAQRETYDFKRPFGRLDLGQTYTTNHLPILHQCEITNSHHNTALMIGFYMFNEIFHHKCIFTFKDIL
ncbi:hypothetical protein Pfo_005579 [Paulownia fortunei]|nr:hypothetical protein Pfo_005579 [Paulownia fortunei]